MIIDIKCESGEETVRLAIDALPDVRIMRREAMTDEDLGGERVMGERHSRRLSQPD
jgi:hypothetical protein